MTQPTTPFEPVREGENEPHAPLEPTPGQPPREVEEPETKTARTTQGATSGAVAVATAAASTPT